MNATATSVLRTTPWQHQRDAVAFVASLYAGGKRGAMIAAAMGTGKSAMTVYLCAEQGFRLILIVCPLRVVQVWKPQFAAHTTTPFQVIPLDDSFAGVRAKQVEAERQLKLAQLRGVPAVIVINYDSVWRPPFAQWALKQKWDLVVADEIHKSRAPGGKASRFMAALGRVAKHKLGLSGTPMPHSPLDVYGYFRFLDATIFGWSFNKFRQHYAVMGGFQNHQVIAYRNLDELNRRYYGITFACGKDVLDLPPEVHVTYSCQLGAEARKIYRSLERDLMAELETGEITVANALVKLLRLQQITGGFVRTDAGEDHQVDSAKMNLLRDVLEDIAPEEPVVVFCRFHRDLETVNRVADETGRRSLELSGRIDELKAWQAGEAPVLAVQIDSGGVGVDLTRARYSIYYSLGFALGSYEQSLARIHRPGQTRPVEHIHLLAEHTVDEKVMTALSRRADVVRAVLQQMKGKP